jgi:hypothetical protein
LSAEELQIRPVETGGRHRLRTVQCPQTDPVSFAVAAGSGEARFPNVAGFSVGDMAARAVAEHAAWLATGDEGVQELVRLIGAARAALLWESVEAGDAELPLTMEATLESLAARGAGPAGPAEAAAEAYRELATTGGRPVAASVLKELRDCVGALTVYAGSEVKLPR